MVSRFLLLTILTLSIISCSKFRKVQRSADWRVKYEAALKYYEKKDYYRATVLFEEILPIVRGLPEGEQIQFYYAYSHFYQRLYLLSSHYFKIFYETYSRSELAEEAQYMYAYSLYRDSPLFNLDQTSTTEAIVSMQVFLNRYPSSQYKQDATDIIDQLQEKLERKAYELAKQYYRVKNYKSALIAFENFRKDYPASAFNEEITFLRLDAQYKLARLSFTNLQEERYKETIKIYLDFEKRYPESEYLKQAKQLYEDSSDQLDKLVENN